ncbi:hypothetical protein K491DRAFT_778315 [Lophiostoma macrostomum CBS 122681]|uniref:Uncharacterized protein n=1 Tax=Lophiostoma macrostomum CBS 122681 TaxID=1314788 RepID=A0A6A6T7T0_9PLEO|nr:hypothetical protein K491DRAFT_778315 [Lophiostoma macrostomum CBS 122681]
MICINLLMLAALLPSSAAYTIPHKAMDAVSASTSTPMHLQQAKALFPKSFGGLGVRLTPAFTPIQTNVSTAMGNSTYKDPYVEPPSNIDFEHSSTSPWSWVGPWSAPASWIICVYCCASLMLWTLFYFMGWMDQQFTPTVHAPGLRRHLRSSSRASGNSYDNYTLADHFEQAHYVHTHDMNVASWQRGGSPWMEPDEEERQRQRQTVLNAELRRLGMI